MRNIMLLLSTIVLLTSQSLSARDLLEISYEGQSTQDSKPKAKQEVIDTAINETAMKYIKDMIGAPKAEKMQTTIKTKILANSGRFVPYIKATENPGGNPKDGFKFTVAMKFSPDDLKQMLLSNGLLYKMEGPPKILPMISFVDKQNAAAYSWWIHGRKEANPFLYTQANVLAEKLKAAFSTRGFFALNPVESDYKKMLPQSFQVENPGTDDLLFLSEFFKAQVLLRGEVKVLPVTEQLDVYKIQVRLSAYQAGNSRLIAEASENSQTERGPFQVVVSKKAGESFKVISDQLSQQIMDSWQRGTFGTSLINLVLRGDLSYPITERIKRALATVQDVKSVKDRMYEPGSITFEVDSSAGPGQLAENIRKADFSPLKVEVNAPSSNTVELAVRGNL